jgi:histidinol-phosphatase (PHP family)
MIPHDYHMHTAYSVDSKASMRDMCLSAVEKGIPEVGFAEHFDLCPEDEAPDWFRLEPWAAELESCRAEFAGRLTVRAGIEVGEPHRYQEGTREMLGRFPFDYVLGSLHWFAGRHAFDRKVFARPADEVFRLYFEELREMVVAGGFDILAHLDVPSRVGSEVYGGYDPTRYEEFIRPVLSECIARGIALEVNTAALRRRAKILNPGAPVVRWFAEMGGTMVTLGSDAHLPGHVGADLPVAMQAVRAAGLRHLTHFELRKPRQAVF